MGQLTLTEALEIVRQTLKEAYGEDSIEYAFSLLKTNEIAAIRAQWEEEARRQTAFTLFQDSAPVPGFFGGGPGPESADQP